MSGDPASRARAALDSALAGAGLAVRRALPENRRRDWDQFRLLSRTAVRQLVDSALLSREADPTEFAVWMLALIATPPAFFAARQALTYTMLKNAPLEVVLNVALTHRLFFVIYGMLAAALLAAMTWEAIFPDGRDQEIVGVLPVRPSVFAAARLWAAGVVGTVFAAAVTLPAAILYSVFCAGHPAFGNPLLMLLGHAAGTMLGALLVFVALLAARGFAAVVLGAHAGAWLGAALQLVAVVLMFEVFFFLPGVLGQLVRVVNGGDPAATMFPPVWFVALHAWIAGEADARLSELAVRGVVTFLFAAALVVPLYLVPARWLGRRALEKRARERARTLTLVVKAMAGLTGATPPVRGLFQFAAASLLRSRRHLLVLASYFGIAVAVCIASILVIEVRGTFALKTPAAWLLALPMVFLFFTILGLRASFRIPTEIDANWPMRMAQPSLAACVNATILLMVTMAVVPVMIATAVLIAPLWPASAVAGSLLMQLASGWALAEIVLQGWRRIPFASAHAPSPDVLKSWWPAYLLAMYLYAFKLSDWQFAALRSPSLLAAYFAICGIAIVVARVVRAIGMRRHSVDFDAPAGHQTERLNLSEALN